MSDGGFCSGCQCPTCQCDLIGAFGRIIADMAPVLLQHAGERSLVPPPAALDDRAFVLKACSSALRIIENRGGRNDETPHPSRP